MGPVPSSLPSLPCPSRQRCTEEVAKALGGCGPLCPRPLPFLRQKMQRLLLVGGAACKWPFQMTMALLQALAWVLLPESLPALGKAARLSDAFSLSAARQRGAVCSYLPASPSAREGEEKGRVTLDVISALPLHVPLGSAPVSCPAAAPGMACLLTTQSRAQLARVMPCLSPPAGAACSLEAARAAKDVLPHPAGLCVPAASVTRALWARPRWQPVHTEGRWRQLLVADSQVQLDHAALCASGHRNARPMGALAVPRVGSSWGIPSFGNNCVQAGGAQAELAGSLQHRSPPPGALRAILLSLSRSLSLTWHHSCTLCRPSAGWEGSSFCCSMLSPGSLSENSKGHPGELLCPDRAALRRVRGQPGCSGLIKATVAMVARRVTMPLATPPPTHHQAPVVGGRRGALRPRSWHTPQGHRRTHPQQARHWQAPLAPSSQLPRVSPTSVFLRGVSLAPYLLPTTAGYLLCQEMLCLVVRVSFVALFLDFPPRNKSRDRARAWTPIRQPWQCSWSRSRTVRSNPTPGSPDPPVPSRRLGSDTDMERTEAAT